MKMFDLFNPISGLLSGPIHGLAYGFEHIPILFAFFLGVVGAVAPRQLTGNISSITIYGNKSLVDKVPWIQVTLIYIREDCRIFYTRDYYLAIGARSPQCFITNVSNPT